MRDDITGQKFGRLTVIEFNNKSPKGQSIWKCQCECGKYKDIRGYHLKGKKIRSCGCLKRETVNIKWNGFGNIGRWVWNKYRVSAIKKKKTFNITAEDMWNQALKQNMKCALTDVELKFMPKAGQQTQSNASLDRIDSSIGYEKHNIQWVLKEINLGKNILTQDQFINMCNLVSKKFNL